MNGVGLVKIERQILNQGSERGRARMDKLLVALGVSIPGAATALSWEQIAKLRW